MNYNANAQKLIEGVHAMRRGFDAFDKAITQAGIAIAEFRKLPLAVREAQRLRRRHRYYRHYNFIRRQRSR